MRAFIFLSALSLLILSASDCHKKQSNGQTFKGKLEIAALCMNYTVRVLEGDIDTSLIVAGWTDENTQKNYKNVFRLGNPCDFPSTIRQGDEFYFTIDTAKGRQCAVCMAYYPTPPKAVKIKVVEK